MPLGTELLLLPVKTTTIRRSVDVSATLPPSSARRPRRVSRRLLLVPFSFRSLTLLLLYRSQPRSSLLRLPQRLEISAVQVLRMGQRGRWRQSTGAEGWRKRRRRWWRWWRRRNEWDLLHLFRGCDLSTSLSEELLADPFALAEGHWSRDCHQKDSGGGSGGGCGGGNRSSGGGQSGECFICHQGAFRAVPRLSNAEPTPSRPTEGHWSSSCPDKGSGGGGSGSGNAGGGSNYSCFKVRALASLSRLASPSLTFSVSQCGERSSSLPLFL